MGGAAIFTLDSGVPIGSWNPEGRFEEELPSEIVWRFLPNKFGFRAGSTKQQFLRMEKGLEVSMVGAGIFTKISETTS